MRKRLCHTISAPYVVGEVFQRRSEGLVDGTTPDNQVTDLFETLTLLSYLKGVIDLHRHHRGEVDLTKVII